MNFAKHWAAVLDDYVIDLAWSPEGSMLAAASAAGGVTLYDASTGAIRQTLAGHEDGANCLAWSPANSQPSTLNPQLSLATGGQDGCVRFWDASTGQQTAETKLGNAWVEHLVWVGRGVPAEPAQPEAVQAVASLGTPYLFAAAGRKLAALHADGSIAHTFPDAPKTISALTVRPALNSQPLAAPKPGEGGSVPTSSLVTDHSSLLVAAACFGHVAIWDTATFTAQKEFPYGNAIYALAWSPDGRWLVAGCHDNAVHLWVPAEDLELHMSGYETRLKELSFSHDSKWLATGGGRDACVWDCSGKGPEGREPMLLPHAARVTAVAFQNLHGLLATGSTDGVFTLWAPTRKNPMFAEVKMPAAATKFSWLADDSLLAVGTEKGHLFVFKTA